MATIADVRSELQIPSSVISDADITYCIAKVTSGDLNLICAEVLQKLLGKYRGRRAIWVGKTREEFDPKEIRAQIRYYKQRGGSSVDDAYVYPDATFTKDGL